MWIFLLFVIILCGGVVGAEAYNFYRDSSYLKYCLGKLANLYSGQLKKHFMAHPSLTFHHEETEYTITAIGGGWVGAKHPSTTVYFYLDEPTDTKFLIQSKSVKSKAEDLLGVKQHVVDNIAFSEKFVVYTDQPDLIHRLLTHPIQQKLLKLSEFAPCSVQYQEVNVANGSVKKPRCSIHLHIFSKELWDYDLLIELAFLFRSQFRH